MTRVPAPVFFWQSAGRASAARKLAGTAKSLSIVAIAVLVFSLGLAGPANAAPLTGVSWAIDRGLVSDADVRYTWTFTTATTATISTVTFTVPTGTGDGGSLTPADVFGLGGGTASRSGTTVTYTVASPLSIPANTPILIAITGFTNTATAGDYTSDVTVGADGPSASNAVTISPNQDTVTVDVLPSLAFSSNKAVVTLNFSGGTTASDTSVFHVKSNAANGYKIYATATPLQSGGGGTIPMVTNSPATGLGAGAFPAAGAWGFSIPTVTNGGSGTLAASGVLGTQYSNTQSTSEIVSQSGTTNDDTINMAYHARVPATQAAGTYTSKITYTAIPSY